MKVYKIKVLAGSVEGDDGKYYRKGETFESTKPWHEQRPFKYELISESQKKVAVPEVPSDVVDEDVSDLKDVTEEFEIDEVEQIAVKRNNRDYYVFDLKENPDVPMNAEPIKKKEVMKYIETSFPVEEE